MIRVVLYLALPTILHRLARRFAPGYRDLRVMGFVVSIITIAATAMVFARPVAYLMVQAAINETPYLSLPYTPNTPVELVANDYHGVGDWPGRDFSAPCGTLLYAPLTGVVSRKGVDTYQGPHGSYNTFLEITDGATAVVLMHGKYIVEFGEQVLAGRTIIGFEASIGNSTRCHTHFSLKRGGELIDPLFLYRPVASAGKPWKISYYDPALGGINCDSDCSTLADGGGWSEADYGFSAACPNEYPLGHYVELPGIGIVECRDRGGAIVCTDSYCWIDLMRNERPPFAGGLVYN